MSYLTDAPPTVAEMTGLEDFAAMAAEQAYDDGLSLADRRDADAAAHLRSQMIAQGRIRPARADATRPMLIAKGLILPADPRELAEVYRVKFTGIRFAPIGDAAADWPWFGRSKTDCAGDEFGYNR